MENQRNKIKCDLPKEWIENFKKGLCPVCGKTKFEFNKGRKVYCSEECKEEYSKKFCSWSELANKIIERDGKICAKCKKSKEQLEIENGNYSYNFRNKYLKEHPEILEHKRLVYMNEAEKLYQKALNLKEEDISPYELPRVINLPNETIHFEVDHKIAICNGGDFWDEKNLQVLCYKCHKEKTKEDLKQKN